MTADATPIRVLAVEDDPDIRMLIELILTRAGCVVRGAGDGPTGLELLAEWEPEVVLLDVGLPGIDGWEVLRRIRAQGEVPVVVLTAYGTEGDRRHGQAAGATAFLSKPFEADDLVARVRECAGRPAPG